MGRNKKNKKTKQQTAVEAQGSTESTSRSSTEISEISHPASYAAAAAKSPAKDNDITIASPATPADIFVDPEGHSAGPPNEPDSQAASQSIFEDDAIDVAIPPTPKTRPEDEVQLEISDGKALDDSASSDFSHLKKDEISEAGSPGQLVKSPGEKDASKEDAFVEAPKREAEDAVFADSPSGTEAVEIGTGTDTKASLYPSNLTVALLFQKAPNTSGGSISTADWKKTFGSENDFQQYAVAAAHTAAEGSADEASVGEGANATEPIDTATTVRPNK